MGESSAPATQRPVAAPGSTRSVFTAIVAVPVGFLAVIWVLAIVVVLTGAPGGHEAHLRRGELWVLAVAGLAVIVGTALVTGGFARRIARGAAALEAAAEAARQRLPVPERGVRGARSAADSGQPAALQIRGTAEIARAASAIARLEQAAVAATAGEATLRDGIRSVVISLARRNQSLLQRQLRLIDALEQKAADPAALADLFPLDHLTTRMRRHAESLIILSGATPGRSWSDPVPVIDVVRGAVAEIEDYTRVRVVARSGDAVAGSAVADMTHLLAELIENATLFSPSDTQVEVRAERVANGFAIEVDDRGLGIKDEQLAELNAQLARPPDFDIANADRLGLFVVARLAQRHDVRVSLRPSPYGGTTAIVLLPGNLVVPQAGPEEATDRLHAAAAPAGADARGQQPSARPGLPARPSSSFALPDGSAGTRARGVQGRREDGSPAVPVRTVPGQPTDATRSDLTARSSGQARPAGPAVSAALSGSGGAGRPEPALAGQGAAPASGNGAAALERDHRDGAARDGAARDDATASAAGSAGAVQAGTYRGLPRRIRQASLSPQLRDQPPSHPAGAGASALADTRTPEQARDLVASMQRGWQRGREVRPGDQQPPPAARPKPHAQEEG
jgi:signal transduction histidine kinase